MGDPRLLEQLFDRKVLAVLKLFFTEPESELYLREIAKKARVSPATTYRILRKLTGLGLLEQVRIRKFKLYKIAKNDNVRFLEQFLREERRIIELFIDNTKALPGIETIILHGREQKDRANLLIIGEGIENEEIKRQCAQMKEEYGFTLSTLSLTKDQFQQMSSMGLYPGQKKVLYKRK